VSFWSRNKKKELADDGGCPLFVLGPPRSGTTLVAKLLNAHPQVLVTNETRIVTFFEHAFRDLPTGDRGGLHCAREHGDEVVAALKEHGRSITEFAYQKIAVAQKKKDVRYWGDKNPHVSSMLDVVNEWFPSAMFVPVRRDPRDTVCSILELWSRMDVVPVRDPDLPRWEIPDEKLRKVCQTVFACITAEERFLATVPDARTFRVDYELLVREPQQVLRPLFRDFLKLGEGVEALAAMKATSQKDVHGALRGKVDFASRSLGRWQRDLADDQCEIANTVFASLL
jgi:hypothetical protein